MQCKIMHISSAWKALTDHGEVPSSVYSILWKRTCKLLIMMVFYDMSNWDCFSSSIVRYKIYSQRSKWGAAVPVVCGTFYMPSIEGTYYMLWSFLCLHIWGKHWTNIFSTGSLQFKPMFYHSNIFQAFFMFVGISLIKQNLNKFCLQYLWQNSHVINYTITKYFD